ncbi:MAG: glycosyltransferase family 2 protein [Algoriphagus sp.]|nr:glycosyltransferase family 2 protein [Algoriphagus sp.]
MELSFIIPCYNHGKYLREALCSISGIDGIQYEIIIVNDGSTDVFTCQLLNELEHEGYKVVHQSNMGLGAARNAGINQALGKYIFPLDSDNKLKQEFINEAIDILRKRSADIVYGDPEFFGDFDEKRLFKPEKFDITKMLFYNYIDACALFSKSVWEKNGGYEVNMPFQGNEDWEFWINAYKNGFNFLYINKPSFYYRIRIDSMISSLENGFKSKHNHIFIINKHYDLYFRTYNDLRYYRNRYLYEKRSPFRTSVKYFIKFINNLF